MDKEKKLKQTQEEEEMEFKDCENHSQQAQQEEEEEEEKIEIGDEIIRSKIGIMRALAERDDPSVKEVDDFMIRRFLRARDLDIEKANTMLLKYLSWRRTFLPKGFVSESEISNQLADNKLCMQGVDKQGRPIVVAFGGRHKPTKGNLEEVKQCQEDKKSSWRSEISKDGDIRTAIFVHTSHLYRFSRIVTQRGLPNCLLFMCLTYS
ncbi:hypothetical protein ES319_A01G021800v1 [Gossypium barbadense]|uniref:CRAL/TRIO N-terminal domain-containing protein n=1 Tax=Gossypium barbadense TaxID=3634 RepID=A0A5J5WV71_GOSBA|nr:hypothetical protein ES319_A01G021800v1 [Gossypium barbadense]